MFASINLPNYFSELSEKSWTVLPVDTTIARHLQLAAQKKSRDFKSAAVTQSATPIKEIRNDRILWLDPQTAETESEKFILENLSALQQELREYFRVSLNEFECHYSIYEPGQYYARHRDTLKSNNKRIFSFVMYLNPEWGPEDGGHIIGYEEQNILFKIQPLAGQLLLFKSDVEHEVLPSLRPRYALTGWMRQ